jgi:hypothetical protein
MTDNVTTLPVVRVERCEIDDAGDTKECAYIRLKGATTRLLMILEHRSERNYGMAMEAVERATAEYRALLSRT